MYCSKNYTSSKKGLERVPQQTECRAWWENPFLCCSPRGVRSNDRRVLSAEVNRDKRHSKLPRGKEEKKSLKFSRSCSERVRWQKCQKLNNQKMWPWLVCSAINRIQPDKWKVSSALKISFKDSVDHISAAV